MASSFFRTPERRVEQNLGAVGAEKSFLLLFFKKVNKKNSYVAVSIRHSPRRFLGCLLVRTGATRLYKERSIICFLVHRTV